MHVRMHKCCYYLVYLSVGSLFIVYCLSLVTASLLYNMNTTRHALDSLGRCDSLQGGANQNRVLPKRGIDHQGHSDHLGSVDGLSLF